MDMKINDYSVYSGKFFQKNATVDNIDYLCALDFGFVDKLDDVALEELVEKFITEWNQGDIKNTFEQLQAKNKWQGTEICLLKIENGNLQWFATGTLRVYLYRKGCLGRITTENIATIKSSWENANANSEQIIHSLEEIGDYKNNIIGGIGAISDYLHCIDASVGKPFILQPEDIIIVCSREVYNVKSDEDIEYVLDNIATEKPKKIVEVVLDTIAGRGLNNYFISLFKWKDMSLPVEKEDIVELTTPEGFLKSAGEDKIENISYFSKNKIYILAFIVVLISVVCTIWLLSWN